MAKRFDNVKFAKLLRDRYGDKAVDKFWIDYWAFVNREIEETPSKSTINSWFYGRSEPSSRYFYGLVKILGHYWEDMFTEKRAN